MLQVRPIFCRNCTQPTGEVHRWDTEGLDEDANPPQDRYCEGCDSETLRTEPERGDADRLLGNEPEVDEDSRPHCPNCGSMEFRIRLEDIYDTADNTEDDNFLYYDRYNLEIEQVRCTGCDRDVTAEFDVEAL